MPTTAAGDGPHKRKQLADGPPRPEPPKRARPHEARPAKPRLIGPHEAALAELEPSYDVAAASVISSTQIRKRVAQAVDHVAAPGDKPRVMLLHARTAAEACKLITVVEHCKRALSAAGKTCHQYNQLFDLPPGTDKTRGSKEGKRRKRNKKSKQKGVAEETDDGADDNGSDNDHFETMQSRLQNAALPPPPDRTSKSLRVFLSCQQIPELKSRRGVTTQTSAS